MKFKFYSQITTVDCGAACLKGIAVFYGKNVSHQYLIEITDTNNEGVNLERLANGARKIDFTTLIVNFNFQALKNAPLPLIAHWYQNHFIVVYKITKTKVFISDPAWGLKNCTHQEFIQGWIGTNATLEDNGFALLLELGA